MSVLRLLPLAVLSACWVTPAEIDAAKRGIVCASGVMDDKEAVELLPQDADDRMEPSCGSPGTEDVAIEFVASSAGCHRIDVDGADSAAVSVSEGCFDGERVCGPGDTPQFAWVDEGESVIVAVEGADGPVMVSVSPLSVTSVDVGAPASGNTATGTEQEALFPDLCAPADDVVTGGDYVRFIVPEDGVYRARLFSADGVDHTFSVHHDCLLDRYDVCALDAGPGGEERLDFNATQGGRLTFRVANAVPPGGAWDLTVERIGE